MQQLFARSKRSNQASGEKTDKAHINPGFPQVAEEPLTVCSPPRTNTNTEQRPQAETSQIAEQHAATSHPPPQDGAGQHPRTDTEHLEAARGPQVSEEPPVMVNTEDLETEDIVIAYVI